MKHYTLSAEETNKCGGDVTLNYLGDNATITSPNYPEHYPGLMDCTWVVKFEKYPEPQAYTGSQIATGTNIRLKFNGPVALETSSDCQFDKLEVSGDKTVPQLGSFTEIYMCPQLIRQDTEAFRLQLMVRKVDVCSLFSETLFHFLTRYVIQTSKAVVDYISGKVCRVNPEQ